MLRFVLLGEVLQGFPKCIPIGILAVGTTSLRQKLKSSDAVF